MGSDAADRVRKSDSTVAPESPTLNFSTYYTDGELAQVIEGCACACWKHGSFSRFQCRCYCWFHETGWAHDKWSYNR